MRLITEAQITKMDEGIDQFVIKALKRAMIKNVGYKYDFFIVYY